MHWRDAISQWSRAVAPHLAEPAHLSIGRRAKPRNLRKFEIEVGRPLPADLTRFLTEQSCKIEFWWDLRNGVIPLAAPEPPHCGYMEFNLGALANLVSGHDYLVEHDAAGPVTDRWCAAFPFLGAPNSDAIALDLHESQSVPPVIYLNHEEPELHVRLAESFEAFLDAWLQLGCVGNEYWVLRHFLTDHGRPLPERVSGTPTSRLDLTSPNAHQFRSFFGLR